LAKESIWWNLLFFRRETKRATSWRGVWRYQVTDSGAPVWWYLNFFHRHCERRRRGGRLLLHLRRYCGQTV